MTHPRDSLTRRCQGNEPWAPGDHQLAFDNGGQDAPDLFRSEIDDAIRDDNKGFTGGTAISFRPGDQVVECDQFYALGPRVTVVGTVKRIHENGADTWCLGLRLPSTEEGERPDWDDAHLFGIEELRTYRSRTDKPYFLRSADLGFLREKSANQGSEAPPRGAGAESAP